MNVGVLTVVGSCGQLKPFSIIFGFGQDSTSFQWKSCSELNRVRTSFPFVGVCNLCEDTSTHSHTHSSFWPYTWMLWSLLTIIYYMCRTTHNTCQKQTETTNHSTQTEFKSRSLSRRLLVTPLSDSATSSQALRVPADEIPERSTHVPPAISQDIFWPLSLPKDAS